MAKSGEKLNDRQRLFIAEYLVDLNATKAAERAGYSKKTARQQAARLLSNVNVQGALSEAFEARIERTEITADRVLEELARVGFSDMRQFLSWSATGVTWKNSNDLDDGAAACVAEVSETFSESGKTRRFKLHSKMSALESLAKHLRLYGDDKGGTTVNVNIDRPKTKPLSEWTDEEIDFMDGIIELDDVDVESSR